MSDIAKKLSGLRALTSLNSQFSRLKSQDSMEIPKGMFEGATQLADATASAAPSLQLAQPTPQIEAASEVEVQGATQIADTNFKVLSRAPGKAQIPDPTVLMAFEGRRAPYTYCDSTMIMSRWW